MSRETQPPAADSRLKAKYECLLEWFREAGSAVVAYSGGADSAFLLMAAHEALGDRCVGVTAFSPSMPRAELESAVATAREIGAPHRVIETHELDDPQYRENSPMRCYFCKGDLFDRLLEFAKENRYAVVADGSNVDDIGDHRPGMQAARDRGVRSPLQMIGLGKQDIRALARQRGLSTWDKPAAACLSSRIPYGTEVTAERLATIEKSEMILKELGIRQLRVRHHGEIARIEVVPEDFARVIENRRQILERMKALGFLFVTIDLEGFRSGSLNAGLDLG
ncbi:MAG: ATP-dependent sacrificial sulfur transferase LarE [Candidatus Eisenbacteria bacterium]|nr:ATP-dependent sacrificial sulfur transferase LarE [Candidatus Eisenbacteria bacterium]